MAAAPVPPEEELLKASTTTEAAEAMDADPIRRAEANTSFIVFGNQSCYRVYEVAR
jgi:hypothetical protein